MLIDEATLLALAPERLTNLRRTRYGGGDMSIRMQELEPDDAARIRELYSALDLLLGELRGALGVPSGDGGAGAFSNASAHLDRATADDLATARVVLERTAVGPSWRSAMKAARELKYPELRAGCDVAAVTRQRQALHDIRGGALAALVLTLELMALKETSAADVVRAFYLTRDHLKIMRNALEDVDPGGRERDRTARDHGSRLLLEKWSSATHRLPNERSARVVVNFSYEGPVSRRCLEFSALDRVLYNLMNNAVRFTSDGVVTLYLRGVGGDLRFIVANEIDAVQCSTLRETQGAELGRLYNGGFTTGGDGVGLSVCGEFVANAYGLNGAEDAVAGGHVGATLVGQAFVAWFHWPMGT